MGDDGVFDLVSPNAASLGLTSGDVANALVIGFGGAKWFKSESEKDILQKAGGMWRERKGMRMPQWQFLQVLQGRLCARPKE